MHDGSAGRCWDFARRDSRFEAAWRKGQSLSSFCQRRACRSAGEFSLHEVLHLDQVSTMLRSGKTSRKVGACIALNRFRDTEIAASGVFLITVIDVLLSRVNKQGGFEGSHLPISLNEGADEAPGQAISRLSQEAQMDTFEDVSVLSN
ncbi:MAG: hypothetical protein HETSPECPRED_008023 [Heterodermia speciosa]|uniref:Uncharacterized protein n=1 Tax=Heterodermia speciosa TaxID=116794 RepID=A0A8H3EMD2_9LECA|nr:MAG: hypothetical protein HETSPECPRED_008023 [Heterodermia speciosa]